MARPVEVDEDTYKSLELAARMTGTTAGEIVARLVAQASTRQQPEASATVPTEGDGITVFADYDGHRTYGRFDPRTTRIDITGGPLSGRSFKTPSSAARGVIKHYKPSVNANRNGWSFWSLDDGSGRLLQAIRHDHD
ncbi:hypothetical protein [Jiangella alkaliphila]|nr:hypothetical protein [Jiangella alkaliphila]